MQAIVAAGDAKSYYHGELHKMVPATEKTPFFKLPTSLKGDLREYLNLRAVFESYSRFSVFKTKEIGQRCPH